MALCGSFSSILALSHSFYWTLFGAVGASNAIGESRVLAKAQCNRMRVPSCHILAQVLYWKNHAFLLGFISQLVRVVCSMMVVSPIKIALSFTTCGRRSAQMSTRDLESSDVRRGRMTSCITCGPVLTSGKRCSPPRMTRAARARRESRMRMTWRVTVCGRA